MTTLNREEIIHAMAVPIHDGNCCTSWEQALKSAEAALDALIVTLPPAKDGYMAYHDSLYRQLLALRRE